MRPIYILCMRTTQLQSWSHATALNTTVMWQCVASWTAVITICSRATIASRTAVYQHYTREIRRSCSRTVMPSESPCLYCLERPLSHSYFEEPTHGAAKNTGVAEDEASSLTHDPKGCRQYLFIETLFSGDAALRSTARLSYLYSWNALCCNCIPLIYIIDASVPLHRLDLKATYLTVQLLDVALHQKSL